MKVFSVEEAKLALVEIVKVADTEFLKEISKWDFHGDGSLKSYDDVCARHFEELENLVVDFDCVAKFERHFWYPLEAIELRTLVPERGSLESYGIGLAILLINDLVERYPRYYMDRRNEKHVSAVLNLPSTIQVPLQAGIFALKSIPEAAEYL